MYIYIKLNIHWFLIYFFSVTLGFCSPPVIEMRVVKGLRVLLTCVQLSPRPCRWDQPPHSHTHHHNNDLEVQVTEKSLGTYVCLCDEVGRDQPPCRRAEYQLTLDNPSMEGNVATAGGRHFLASHIIFFVAGFVLGGIPVVCNLQTARWHERRRALIINIGKGAGLASFFRHTAVSKQCQSVVRGCSINWEKERDTELVTDTICTQLGTTAGIFILTPADWNCRTQLWT